MSVETLGRRAVWVSDDDEKTIRLTPSHVCKYDNWG